MIVVYPDELVVVGEAVGVDVAEFVGGGRREPPVHLRVRLPARVLESGNLRPWHKIELYQFV